VLLPLIVRQSQEEVRMWERNISKNQWTRFEKPEVRGHLGEAEIRI